MVLLRAVVVLMRSFTCLRARISSLWTLGLLLMMRVWGGWATCGAV